jgi:endonuclease G, mitochondrial
MSTDRAARIAAYLRDIADDHGVEAMRVDPEAVESMRRARKSQESLAGLERMQPQVQAETLNAAIESVAMGKELSKEHRFGLEAIIIPDKRPVMPLQGGTYSATHKLWLHLNDAPVKARLTRAAKSIGRIEVKGSDYPYGGTGFVVGPGLIMTNRHVAEIFASGVGEKGLSFVPGISPGFSRSFAPDNDENPAPAITGLRMVHPYWDMALLEVEGLAAEPLLLSTGPSEAFEKHEIAVIGYPAFDPRNDPDVQSRLYDNRFGIKQLQPGKLRERQSTESYGKLVTVPTHDCSTLGGVSGAGVIHIETGKVIGLHFGGEYLRRNFAVSAADLAADPRVVDAGVSFDPAARPAAPPSWTGYWTELDEREAAPAEMPAGQVATPAIHQVMDITVPVTVRIEPGAAGSLSVTLSGQQLLAAATEKMVEPVRDANYASRRGYDEAFLGTAVPPPLPKSVAVLAKTLKGGLRLDYENFSVQMHAKRRLALITAANVTAETKLKTPEPGKDYTRKGLTGLGENDQEKWFLDPRMDARFQLPDVFFTRDNAAFDKGHVVRREDVAWGKTYAVLRRANGDSYHVTNCSPQVAGFNQSARGKDNWGDLENVVLSQAASERLCVFAGPVLAPGDPRFLGQFGQGERRLVQIPLSFWKVIVARAGTGIAAFGFILEQDLSEVETTEFVVPQAFRRFLVPLPLIAEQAGISFAAPVLEADQFDDRGPDVAVRANVGRKHR